MELAFKMSSDVFIWFSVILLKTGGNRAWCIRYCRNIPEMLHFLSILFHSIYWANFPRPCWRFLCMFFPLILAITPWGQQVFVPMFGLGSHFLSLWSHPLRQPNQVGPRQVVKPDPGADSDMHVRGFLSLWAEVSSTMKDKLHFSPNAYWVTHWAQDTEASKTVLRLKLMA